MDFKKKWDSTGQLEFVTSSEWNASGNLDFVTEWNTSGKLEFVNDSSSSPTVNITEVIGVSYVFSPVSSGSIFPTITAIGESSLLAPTTQANVSYIIEVAGASEVFGINSDHEIVFDINVDRGPKTDIKTITDRSSYIPLQIDSQFADSPKLTSKKLSTIFDADQVSNTVKDFIGQLSDLSNSQIVTIFDAVKAQATIAHIRNRLDKVNHSLIAAHEDALNASNNVFSGYKYPPRGDCSIANAWAQAETLKAQIDGDFNDGIAVKSDWIDAFENGINATGTRPADPIIPPIIITPPSAILNFLSLWDNSGELDFLRIELEALIVMNDFKVEFIAPDNARTEIKPTGCSIGFDIDSFAWTFSGTLHGDDNLTYLKQTVSGAPKFEVMINGYLLGFVVRDYKRSRALGGNSYQFSAVSSSQFLTSPWSAKQSVSPSQITTAWQLVDSQVTPKGFTVTRTLTPDWTLAANSFNASQASPIDILNEVLEACGAIVQPALIGDVLNIQPRYKVSPWDWAALSDEDCDHIIPDYALTVESGENMESPDINSVLIAGETHGVISLVTKEGSAGDSAAEDVVSQLSQDHNVNAELARNIMADSGNEELVGISLPLLAPGNDFGLLLPGQIARIKYSNGDIITGLCLNNQLAVNGVADIWQSAKMEFHHGYS